LALVPVCPIVDEGTKPMADEVAEPPIGNKEDEAMIEEEHEAFYVVDWLEHDSGKRIPIQNMMSMNKRE
jgi:hypothetical protein